MDKIVHRKKFPNAIRTRMGVLNRKIILKKRAEKLIRRQPTPKFIKTKIMNLNLLQRDHWYERITRIRRKTYSKS